MTFDARRKAWIADAACRGDDPDIWHPASGKVNIYHRRTCKACPIAQQCLQMALDDPTLEGIHDATSLADRNRMRQGIPRPQHVDKCGSYAGFQQHARAKEPPCGPCRAARNERSATRYRQARNANVA